MLDAFQGKSRSFLVRPGLTVVDFLPAPFPLSVLAFFLGCIGYFFAPLEPVPVVVGGIAAINAVFALVSYRRAHLLGMKLGLLCLGLSLGMGYSQWSTHRQSLQSAQLELSAQRWTLAGTLKSRETISQSRVRLRLEEVTLNHTPVTGDVRVTSWLEPERVAVGDSLEAEVVLFAPSPPVVPGGFDFQRWAFFDQLLANGYTVNSPRITRHSSAETGFWHPLRATVDQAITDNFAPAQAALMRTLLLGNRQGLSEQQWQQFRLAGLAHLLAISGMHIGMIAFSVFGFVRALATLVPRIVLFYPVHRYAAVIAVIMAAGYVGLAGGTVSANRAFLMLALFMLGIVWETQTLRFHSLCCAALLIMLYQPFTVTSAGFQLSFAAVWVMVAYYTQPRPTTKPDFFVSVTGGKMVKLMRDISVCTLLITLVTAPILWWHFQVLYSWGLIGNLLAIPLMGTVVMPLVFLYFMAVLCDQGGLVAPLLSVCLDGLTAWADMVGALPHAEWKLPLPPLISVLIFSAIAHGLVLHWRKLELSHYMLIICFAALGALVYQQTPRARAILIHDENSLAIADGDSWMYLGEGRSRFYQQQLQQYWQIPQQAMPDEKAFSFAGWRCEKSGTTDNPVQCHLPGADTEIRFKDNQLQCYATGEYRCVVHHWHPRPRVTFLGFTGKKIWLDSGYRGRPWQKFPQKLPQKLPHAGVSANGG